MTLHFILYCKRNVCMFGGLISKITAERNTLLDKIGLELVIVARHISFPLQFCISFNYGGPSSQYS
jgi:hypothetical protein